MLRSKKTIIDENLKFPVLVEIFYTLELTEIEGSQSQAPE
jgi:hypothetical protein